MKKKLFHSPFLFLFEDNIEYSLPYGWKKIGHRRTGDQDRWDFYITTPDGKKLRSNPEIDKYLEKNPNVGCDRRVTNTSRPWADRASPTKQLAVTNSQTQNDDSKFFSKYLFISGLLCNFFPSEVQLWIKQ